MTRAQRVGDTAIVELPRDRMDHGTLLRSRAAVSEPAPRHKNTLNRPCHESALRG